MKHTLSSSDHKRFRTSLRNLHNNWKAIVTEKLVNNYIEAVVIPSLISQGWNRIIYTSDQRFKIFYDENESQRPEHKQGVWNNVVQGFFIENGLYPTKEFMNEIKKLISLIKHYPDGYLFKFKENGKSEYIKRNKDSEGVLLPIVNGEIELVEVKSGKGRLFSGQKEDYCNALKENFVLRYYRVNLISFEKNEFEIDEKIIMSIDELMINEGKQGLSFFKQKKMQKLKTSKI